MINKKKIYKIGLEVYSTKLENGLEIYIVPNNYVNGIYATYTTKYGSIDNTFIPSNGNKMVKYPKGIAHFLEHKLFEQANGVDAGIVFSKNGADVNANTNSRKTTYLFRSTINFYENLKTLINFVENPYFTDANVEKEKGIIEQEIKMYHDNPESRLYEGVLFNSFIKNELKYDTAGTVESINSITKEDLYDCYNTFYNPSNMFIVITGNVEVEKTIAFIENMEHERKNLKPVNIKRKKIKEPLEVFKKEETIKMDVSIPLFAISYKIPFSSFKTKNKDHIIDYLSYIIKLKFNSSSLFYEELSKQGLLNSSLEISVINADDHVLIIIAGEAKEYLKVQALIKQQITNFNIDELAFERRKKVEIGLYIQASDNIYSINNSIVYQIVRKNKIKYNELKYIKNLKFAMAKETFFEANFNNYTIFNIVPIDN